MAVEDLFGRRLSRRTALKLGVAGAVASELALLEQLAWVPLRAQAAGGTLPDIQFDIGKFIAPPVVLNDGAGNVTAGFGPVFATFTPAKLTRTPKQVDQRIREGGERVRGPVLERAKIDEQADGRLIGPEVGPAQDLAFEDLEVGFGWRLIGDGLVLGVLVALDSRVRARTAHSEALRSS